MTMPSAKTRNVATVSKGCGGVGLLWVTIPVSLAMLLSGVPTYLGIAADSCAVMGLFITVSLSVASFINEEALHSMFLRVPSSGIRFPLWVRAMNWIAGTASLFVGLRVADAIDSGLTARSDEMLLFFLSLTYLDTFFNVACACVPKGPTSRLGLSGLGVCAIWAMIVAVVAVRIDASMLPLIVTADAAIMISLPLLRDVVIRKIAEPVHTADSVQWSRTPQGASLDIRGGELRLASLPRATYLVLTGTAIWFAPTSKLAVLLNVMPTRLLALHEGVQADAVDAANKLLRAEVTLSFTVCQLVAFVLLATLCICLCCRDSSSAAASRAVSTAEDENVKRKRLAMIRASSEIFPPPYPNGWYCLCKSEDVATGKAIAASACHKEFVVFRGADGKAAVLNAFCPHLGTHLGHGGAVVGNSVVCPYHSWAFDANGKCTDIPYCPKAPTERSNTTAYPMRERLGLIFVWLHAEGAEPTYELTIFDRIEGNDMQAVFDVQTEPFHMHIMEPSQNASDPYHFNTTHSWLGGKDGGRSALWLKHEAKTHLASLGHKDHDGNPLEETVIDLKETVAEMWIFGLIPVPKVFNSHYSSGATFQGPQVSTFNVDSKMLGSLRIIFAFTPEAPFRQRVTCRVFRTRGFPWLLARFIGRMAMATIEQDRKVWEHKLHVAPRNVVSGDGPFAAYGVWLRQFYSESSKEWCKESLDW